jgi:hypothetical protein
MVCQSFAKILWYEGKTERGRERREKVREGEAKRGGEEGRWGDNAPFAPPFPTDSFTVRWSANLLAKYSGMEGKSEREREKRGEEREKVREGEAKRVE